MDALHLILSRQRNKGSTIKFVNTSMHGVGDPFVKGAFSVAGFQPYVAVKEQQDADPEFPTVKFPNPEEKGKKAYCTLIYLNYSKIPLSSSRRPCKCLQYSLEKCCIIVE